MNMHATMPGASIETSPIQNTMSALADRFHRYRAAGVDSEISGHDDMFAGDFEHYLRVGAGAIDVLAQSMVAAGKSEVASVLDLPCGGGRVTRHLAAFFPEASLFVGDINKEKERDVAAQFSASVVDPGAGFDRPPERTFDLIWVGSLLTHLNHEAFQSALTWFVRALAPDGVLVATTQGRKALARRQALPSDSTARVPDELWRVAMAGWNDRGFGFWPDTPEDDHPRGLGGVLISPDWLLRSATQDTDVRVVSFAEAGWVGAQDVLTLQRKSLAGI